MIVEFRFTLITSLFVGCALLAGCSREAGSATHTVDWYLSHTTDRASMVQRCTNDPGTLANTPDCVNAFAAAQRVDIGSLRSLPPIGLVGAAPKPHARPGARIPESR